MYITGGLCSMNDSTLNDDPNGPTQQNTVTLRDAIETGNNGGGIGHGSSIEPVTFINPSNGDPLSGTITLQAALPAIQKSYNVSGPGSSTLTVNGNNAAGTIFTVNAGVTSTISGLTITGGNGGDGGGIYNQGDLTLNDIVLKNNQTAGKGGGIYNDSGGQLNLQTVTIGTAGNPNTATQGGGGLYNSGSVTIHDSVIVSNAAGGGGGGIYNYEGTIQAFDDTEINHNSDNGLRGGGVYNNEGKFQMYGGYIPDNQETKSDGGGVYNYFGTMTLTGVSVLGNRAIGYGGGIYTYEGSLTLTHNVFIGSSAGTDRNFAHRGGGMYVNGSVVKMTGGAITNNTATTPTTGGGAGALSGGGGLYVNAGSLTLTNVSISHNKSMTNGGGVYVRSGSLELINDIITYNANGGFGGGMLIKGGTVTVSGGTLQYNQAGNGAGGGIYNYLGSLTLNSYAIGGNIFPVLILNNYASSNGGGMFLANNSKTTFNDATVSGNTTFLNTQTTGRGVFEQQFATVNITGVLNDKDDDGGVPYRTGVT